MRLNIEIMLLCKMISKKKTLKYVVIDHNAFNQAQYMKMLSIREEFLKFTSNLPPAKREKLLENLDRYILSDWYILLEK